MAYDTLFIMYISSHHAQTDLNKKSSAKKKNFHNPKVDTLRVQKNLKSKSYTVKNLGKFIKMWIIMKFQDLNQRLRAYETNVLPLQLHYF